MQSQQELAHTALIVGLFIVGQILLSVGIMVAHHYLGDLALDILKPLYWNLHDHMETTNLTTGLKNIQGIVPQLDFGP